MSHIPPPPVSRPQSSHVHRTFSFWLMIGLMFSILQFGVCEITHQLSMRVFFDSETLPLISDTVSWPAVKFYDAVEFRLTENALHRVAEGGESFTDKQQERAAELLKNSSSLSSYEERDPIYKFLWSVPEIQEDITVSPLVEYGIYIGTCVCWGLLVALGGFLLFRDPAVKVS